MSSWTLHGRCLLWISKHNQQRIELFGSDRSEGLDACGHPIQDGRKLASSGDEADGPWLWVHWLRSHLCNQDDAFHAKEVADVAKEAQCGMFKV